MNRDELLNQLNAIDKILKSEPFRLIDLIKSMTESIRQLLAETDRERNQLQVSIDTLAKDIQEANATIVALTPPPVIPIDPVVVKI